MSTSHSVGALLQKLNPKRLPGFSALFSLVVSLVFIVSSCSTPTAAAKPNVIKLDFAYYNPVSLVLKDKGWLE